MPSIQALRPRPLMNLRATLGHRTAPAQRAEASKAGGPSRPPATCEVRSSGRAVSCDWGPSGVQGVPGSRRSD